MPDASATGDGDGPSQESIIDVGEQRIRVLPGASDTAASFEFEGEDHTLGNALRYMIMKNPEVEFCGYSIPHPSEAKMNVRIQTYEGTNVYDALEKGLDNLMDLCDVVRDKFTLTRDAFAAKGS
ncbi:MAG: DNA-directed RNA polymerase I and III polypeptide [Lasallia pustulata]|nr:MAG: DNA-directed RNA polymerase I and III polypeptide [Lasallia pustulata]